MDYEPPFQETYKNFLQNSFDESEDKNLFMVEECELPLINLSQLNLEQLERDKCIKEIAEAARQWGFFQVVNHGVPQEILNNLQYEQKMVFHLSFEKKAEEKFLNLSTNSYRWGNPEATSLKQVPWSETLHISLADISRMDKRNSLRSTIDAFGTTASTLAQSLAEILAQSLGIESNFFRENFPPKTSYIRMNRYPKCPLASKVFGLVPHSDSNLLTILYQDQVGGLQLMKDGRWFKVKPNPKALIINIGDLFQALSNDVFKSIKHRVVSPQEVERFSAAYFYCPSNDAVIQSYAKPAMYRPFTLREYRQQIQKDVQDTGDKIGLSRFLLSE
ncbi:gibberellin 2-beta-dioxygenase 8-like [Quercus lobata]|uniref:gibberellin 2-beta-dioxygenase 8-like n=1 Tax=Quercus lobata TaxID=97700 RepID=UPI0012473E64|nr:gibberellin 2-beta-dioxygenase 8-like [Quercus lobata]